MQYVSLSQRQRLRTRLAVFGYCIRYRASPATIEPVRPRRFLHVRLNHPALRRPLAVNTGSRHGLPVKRLAAHPPSLGIVES